jgi:hypothetical protein
MPANFDLEVALARRRAMQVAKAPVKTVANGR